MSAVAIIGLMVAALRAEETKREDRLFEDPFAEALAGNDGRALLARFRAAETTATVPIIEVRTRWYDEAIERTLARGLRQVVILAAGMDSRAYRLSWPAETRLTEIDQPEVIALKAERLGGAMPRCTRVAIGISLAEGWVMKLDDNGFDRTLPTLWLIEGLLQYLTASFVDAILMRVDACSAPGSVALADVPSRALLELPALESTRRMMGELGAPWSFATDEPAGLMCGWDATVTEAEVVGSAWKRWPFPAAPAEALGIPRTYLVEANKVRRSSIDALRAHIGDPPSWDG